MLSLTLEAEFSSDGNFDVGATFEGLVTRLAEADFGEVEFDATEILDLISGLTPPQIGDVLGSAGTVLANVGDLDDLVSVDDLLAALRDLTAAVTAAEQIDLASLGVDIEGSLGIDAVARRFDPVTAALETGPVADLFGVLGDLVPGISLTSSIGRLRGPMGGIVGLLTLTGGLMATEAITAKLLTQTNSLSRMLDVPLARDAAARLETLAARPAIVADLGTIDPSNITEVERVVAPVVEFMRTVHEVREVWTTGLGFGEAALLGLDVASCAAGLVVARTALDETALSAVADLATTVRDLVAPVLAVPLPDATGTVDEIVGEGLEMLVELRDAVAAFDAATVVGVVTGSLEAITAPITEVVAAIEGVATTVSSAMRTVRDAAQAFDIRPIADAVDTAVAPVVGVLDSIELAITTAQEPIVSVAGAVVEVLGEARGSIEAAATAIDAALGRLETAFEAVDIAAVQAAIESGLGEVADQLSKAQLTPYFGATIDVIDTTADVVDAVPFGMLPTDVQQEVVDAVKPVKEIRFDLIADELQATLAGIVAGLDTDVLDEVETAYQAVLEFLSSIDPRAAIGEFEAGPFAEFATTVRSIDPAAVLEPVDEALAEIQGLLSGLDLEQDVLGPVQEVFDGLLAQFEELDPATLLEPMRTEIDDVRQAMAETLRLEEWAPAIVRVRDLLVDLLGRVDPEAMTSVFERSVIDNQLTQLPTASGLIGAVVSGFAQATDLPAEVDAWDEVRHWFGEVDGRASVEGRLQAAADAVAATRDAVRLLDPAPLVTAAQTQYRSLTTSVAALPPDSLLRTALDPVLEGPPPSQLLGPIVENRARYLARLEVDATALVQVSVKGRGEITAITDGLVDALRPITSLGAWLRNLLARFGITDPERPLAGLIETLLDGAGLDPVLPPLRDLVGVVRDKLMDMVDGAVAPALDVTGSVETALALIDIGTVVDELQGLHDDLAAQIAAMSPQELLGDVLSSFDALVDRLESFDSLALVRDVIDEMTLTVEMTFDTLRPTVVFEDVSADYATILDLAAGLDVATLMEPVVFALEGIALQLDTGLEVTAEALGRLQAALPSEVSSSSAAGSVSVSGGISL